MSFFKAEITRKGPLTDAVYRVRWICLVGLFYIPGNTWNSLLILIQANRLSNGFAQQWFCGNRFFKG